MTQICCPTCGVLRTDPSLVDSPPSPRVLELLSVNTPPQNDAEINDLRRIVQESSVLMESLQDQLKRAQETVSTLQALRDNTLRRLVDVKKILHPIRSFPQDLLAEIFLLCTPIIDETMRDFKAYDPEFDTLCPRNHPWNLSHVCRRWRKTALSLPRLWSTIYLNFGQYGNLTNRQCVYKGNLLFERSANMDLSMTLGGGEEGIVDHPLTGFLEASAPRWRTLNVRLPSWSLQSFSGWEFPTLRELGIGYKAGTDSTDYYIDIFRNVANVRTVSFYHTDGPDESYNIVGPFPWSIVTRLSCYSFSAEHQFMSILERSAGLQELTIKIGMIYINVDMDQVVLLPMLQHVDITEYHDGQPGTLAEFLHLLRVPSIRRLALTFPAHFIDFQCLPSHPDLHRVTSLQIQCSMGLIPEGEDNARMNYIGGTKTLFTFLALMTGVECFQLKDEVSTEFLDGLVAKGWVNGTTLLPSLRALDLHECTFVNSADARQSILRITESRGCRALTRPCAMLGRIELPNSLFGNTSGHEQWTIVSNSLEVQVAR